MNLPQDVSESTKRRNPELYPDHRATSGAKPESAVLHEPVGKAEGKEAHPVRILVRVIAHRRRLVDPDNLCPKFFIDCLRYAGLIPDDRAKDIDLSVVQEKDTSNFTEIIVTYPDEKPLR